MMKKSLIALAVLAASGAAMAQSSVTLYGVADLGLAKLDSVSGQMSGNGLMNNGSSRLGVRGVEDLGGGLKAGFNFEQGINGETGATDGNTFQRAAKLYLQGNFGTFQMGRTLNPSFYGVAAWELTGTANYSAVANQFGFAGGPSRNNSQFSYKTPNFAGFSAEIGYVAKPDNVVGAVAARPAVLTSTGLAGAPVFIVTPAVAAIPGTPRFKTDLNVIYANGPLAVALSANKVDSFGTNSALGAKYTFGAFDIAGSLQNPTGDQKGFTLGAGATFGAVHVTFDVARDTHFKDTDFVLEAKYALSKRTFAYAAALRDGNGHITAANPLVTGTTNNENLNHYGIGLRHNF